MTDKKDPIVIGSSLKRVGRPTMSEADKKLTRINKTQFKKAIGRFLGMTYAELKDIVETSRINNLTTLEALILRSLLFAIRDGDINKLDWFLKQLFGEANTQKGVAIINETKNNKNTVILQLPDNGRTI